ncbi:MAG: protein-L-isoaspartate(D-aspartate) O-methyltransferase [Candidatus Omnitrophica bacterium]|nr:protein-L-isoaspartate(D-aspartate) O-methyltransferase [Candidatus Omnitrophota bacterium]
MDYGIQRKRMVDEQLLPRGIKDPRVIEAFLKVPREAFVPRPYNIASYADRPLPIGEGQTISQPYIVALMTECLGLSGGEKVLEVGTGSGYQAAILAEICAEVYTVERQERLLKRTRKLLDRQGYRNIHFMCGDGTLGWDEGAPYDGIIVTAAAPQVPERLKDQLAEEGRLVIPVGEQYSQVLSVVTRRGNDFARENVCGCVFVPLIGEDGWHLAE